MTTKIATLSLMILCSSLLIAAVRPAPSEKAQPLQGPRLVLWSWEHNDDLTFVDPKKVAVSYYAGTIVLGRDIATLHKRRNPFHVAKQVVCFPSFRIEKAHPYETISALTFASALDIIATYAKQIETQEVQIDFDATMRDRKPYLRFLQDLKGSLPDKTRISITALGSWCLYDRWLQKAPVDETVAMMFSLGRDREETLNALANRPLNSGASCAQSLGISVYEQITNQELHKHNCLAGAKRIYAFSALGWTKSRYEQILAEVDKQ